MTHPRRALLELGARGGTRHRDEHAVGVEVARGAWRRGEGGERRLHRHALLVRRLADQRQQLGGAAHERGGEPLGRWAHRLDTEPIGTIKISMRRLRWRPSAVALLARG